MKTKHYWTDITISITGIDASSKKQADEIIQEFISKISPIMEDKVRWDEADWTIQEDVLDEDKGEWVTL
jgi:hypothetical protein